MKTVLIVEDEKMIRQGIRVMIQRYGVPVENIVECSNGEGVQTQAVVADAHLPCRKLDVLQGGVTFRQ